MWQALASKPSLREVQWTLARVILCGFSGKLDERLLKMKQETAKSAEMLYICRYVYVHICMHVCVLYTYPSLFSVGSSKARFNLNLSAALWAKLTHNEILSQGNNNNNNNSNSL